jgi:hypothetical protein
MIVTLAQNLDYLKRIKEVVADANVGITQPELDNASNSAEADVRAALYAMGYPQDVLITWTSETNTPFNIIECIKLLASARVWARMLLMYRNEVSFDQTMGAALLEMANSILENLGNAGIIVGQDGSIITPGGNAAGKGVMKFHSARLGYGANKQIVPDEAINNFIQDYGPTKSQRDQHDRFLDVEKK